MTRKGMNPIVAVTGPTGSEKTALAVSLARRTGATILPLDQLHRYACLPEGTGLDVEQLAQVKHFGYQVLSPWEVSGPDKYAAWLRSALCKLSQDGPVIIEGGCTSYLSKLLASSNDDVLGEIKFVALTPPLDSDLNRARIEQRVSSAKVAAVIRETQNLERHGFICDAGLPFLLACEKLWKHPEHDDPNLAWAIRISARVYCPAYLALKEQLSVHEARTRIVNNVCEIQQYQRESIERLVDQASRYESDEIPAVTRRLVRLLENSTSRSQKTG